MKTAPSLSLKDTGRIYLDYNATTPPLLAVTEQVPVWLKNWGNPSSIHHSGRGPKNLLREARQNLSQMLGCQAPELIFTSGGSESNNLIIKSFLPVKNSFGVRNEFITTTVEHPSVKECFRQLESQGAIVHWLPVDRGGSVNLEFFKNKLSDRVALVSIMAANNETGSLFPIKEMAQMAHNVGAKFHTDAVQAAGKIPVHLHDWGVDYASFASHKIYALRGAGLVYSRKGEKLKSLISGGGQERGRRAGTENILTIAAFGYVAGLFLKHQELRDKMKKMAELRDELEQKISSSLSGVHLTGAQVQRLPNTSSLVLDNVDGESLLMNLDLEGVSVSTGAACSSGNPEPSPTLLAMGLTRSEAQSSLRISLGWDTTLEDISTFFEILKNVVTRLREFRDLQKSTVTGGE